VTISRTELLLILLITVLGAALRVARLDELAVEHFDEGVYASNLLFTAEEDFEYPQRFLYAPPLLPSFVEWSQILTGGATWAPFLPSLLLGALTVPLAWGFVRRGFSGCAGIAAASLVALNDFHIALSRSVLTDAPLAFLLMLAVWLFAEALASRRLGWAVAGGIATGLAWSTKYNGWLPLAILTSGGTAGVLAAQWINRRCDFGKANRDAGTPRSRSKQQTVDAIGVTCGWSEFVKTVVVAGATGCVTWLPVWFDLQDVGGYSRVAENHRQYVIGLSGWWDGAVRHEAVQRHYAGWSTLLSAWLAALAATLVWRGERSTWNEFACETADSRSTWNEISATGGDFRSTWNDSFCWLAFLTTGALASVLVLSPLLVVVAWSLIEFPTRLLRLARWRLQKSPRECPDRWQIGCCAAWLCLAWLCGLLLATPLYRPYPRLLMPLLVIACIGTGAAIARVLRLIMMREHPLPAANDRSVDEPSPKAKRQRQPALRLGWLILVVGLCVFRVSGRSGLGWQNRSDLVSVAERCITSATENCEGEPSSSPEIDCIIYVYGEPALFYHLSRDRVLARPVASLDVAHEAIPTFVVTGPHAARSPQFTAQLEQAGNSMTLVDEIPFRLSDFVLLDEFPPSRVNDQRVHVARLFRVR
jgi:hypothetical protein